MYSACSLDNVSSSTPIFARWNAATFSSRCLGRVYTAFSYLSEYFHSSIWASTWLEKELDMTNEGCPVAQPRFTSRPSASKIISWSLLSLYKSTWGLISLFSALLVEPGYTNFIIEVADVTDDGLVLHIHEVLFADNVLVSGSRHNDVGFLHGMSPCASRRSRPWRPVSAQIGSISVTVTRTPAPRNEAAEPLPTSP